MSDAATACIEELRKQLKVERMKVAELEAECERLKTQRDNADRLRIIAEQAIAEATKNKAKGE